MTKKDKTGLFPLQKKIKPDYFHDKNADFTYI